MCLPPSQPRFLFSPPVRVRPPSALCAEWRCHSCSMEDGEKEDTAKEEEQAEALWADVTKRKKRRCGQKVEKPEAFMANFFKGLEIYQTKLLVSTLPLSHSGAGVGAGRPLRGGHCLCFTIQLVVLPHLSHSSSLPLNSAGTSDKNLTRTAFSSLENARVDPEKPEGRESSWAQGCFLSLQELFCMF